MLPNQPTEAGQSARRKYHTLDGIRGTAALMILLRHAAYFFGRVGLYVSSSESYLAVDLFFVLSGFVIAGAYDKRLAGGLSPVEFIKIRTIRLYPLYLLGLSIGAISALLSIFGNNTADLTIPELGKDFIFAFLMLPTPFSPALYPLNPPSWSLFFEMVANGLYAVFYPFLTTGILIASISAAAAALGYCAFQNGTTDGGGVWVGSIVGLFRVIYSFGAGLLIHRFHKTIPNFRLPSWVLLCLVLILLSVAPSAQVRPWYDMMVVIFMFPVMVHVASASEPRSQKVIRLYSLLGITSYAVYVLHDRIAPFVAGAFRKIFRHDAGQFAPLSGVVFLLGLVYGCWLLDRFYDQPVRRWATRMFLKKS